MNQVSSAHFSRCRVEPHVTISRLDAASLLDGGAERAAAGGVQADLVVVADIHGSLKYRDSVHEIHRTVVNARRMQARTFENVNLAAVRPVL